MTTSTSKRHVLLASLAGLGALAAGIMTATRIDTKERKEDKLDELWALTLQTPTDAPLGLAQFKDKPLLINFWATWCAPCLEEMPMLDRFYQDQMRSAPKSFELLGIALDKSESVLKFLNITPVRFPIGLAGFEGIALSQRLGNAKGGLPFSLLISKEGAILFKKEGQLTTEDLEMTKSMIGRS
jgi:thiol-disulfide isomerase/thioredoxin